VQALFEAIPRAGSLDETGMRDPMDAPDAAGAVDRSAAPDVSGASVADGCALNVNTPADLERARAAWDGHAPDRDTAEPLPPGRRVRA
jgi:hypothetical protein